MIHRSRQSSTVRQKPFQVAPRKILHTLFWSGSFNVLPAEQAEGSCSYEDRFNRSQYEIEDSITAQASTLEHLTKQFVDHSTGKHTENSSVAPHTLAGGNQSSPSPFQHVSALHVWKQDNRKVTMPDD